VKRYPLALTVLVLLVVSSYTGGAFGHGLGEDQAVPVTIGEKQITVSARINPAGIPFDSSVKPTLLIRAHDENSNVTVTGIDYRVTIELRNETLLEQRFRSSDGIILANLIPNPDIQQWQITGHESAGPEDQVEVSQGMPVEIASKILAVGGLYHIEVTLEQTSPGIALQRDVKFDLYISIAHSLEFTAETPDSERNIVVKTYYDDVDEFDYQNGTISFSMPFDWDLDYVSLVSVLHMEVQFPRSIEALKTNSYTGSLNGITLPAQSIQIDDYSSEENRIVHFVVANDRLSDIAESLEDGTNSALFTLTGAERPRFPIDLLTTPTEKYLFQLSWGPEVIETGVPITFVMNIQDPVTGDLIRRPSFDFVMTQGGNEIYKERLQSDIGTFANDYTFSQPGVVTLSANNINGEGESARIDLVVLQGSGNPAPQPPQQPSGCLIATAAYGSELSPQVQYLRNFREQYILSTAAGSAFMSTFNSVYYSFSPQVADYEREQPWLQSIVKAGLYPLFGILMISERAHFGAGGGEMGAVMAGVIASSLIGATYLLPAGIGITRKIGTKWILLSLGASGALLFTAVVAVPALLPHSTAGFVLVLAGSAALLAAKPLLRVFKRN
jgi:hypothetical protein